MCMRGRAINFEIDAGRGKTLEVEPVNEAGELWGFGGQTVVGELRDEKTDSVVGNLECRVTGEGTVLDRKSVV